MKGKKITIDTTQLFQAFHILRDDNMITKDQHKNMLSDFTSSKSFGPGYLGRNEISYEDFCLTISTFDKYFDAYRLGVVWSHIGKYVALSMLINKSNNEI